MAVSIKDLPELERGKRSVVTTYLDPDKLAKFDKIVGPRRRSMTFRMLIEDFVNSNGDQLMQEDGNEERELVADGQKAS